MPKESAYTSLNQIPAGFKAFEFGVNNLDIGGGKYDTASDYLAEQYGTINLVYDEFNRSKSHNNMVLQVAINTQLDSITVFNVLNVIQSKKERRELLKGLQELMNEQWRNGAEPVIIFQVYEGDRTGKPSKKTVQTNMKTVDYIPEIQKVFPEWEVQRQGNYLIV